jgi:hypothetical protein
MPNKKNNSKPKAKSAPAKKAEPVPIGFQMVVMRSVTCGKPAMPVPKKAKSAPVKRSMKGGCNCVGN